MSALTALSTGVGLARSLAIYYGQPWRRQALERFYAGLVGPGALAFDIGAHVGNRAWALRRAGARVVALEPQPAFHRFLAATLPRDGIELVGQAVGAAPGRAGSRSPAAIRPSRPCRGIGSQRSARPKASATSGGTTPSRWRSSPWTP